VADILDLIGIYELQCQNINSPLFARRFDFLIFFIKKPINSIILFIEKKRKSSL
jgi:hypothetical protein